MNDYIQRVSGFSAFARVPTQVLLDPSIGPRQFLVFCALASHANISGHTEVSQARIAEMCGFLSNGKPDNSLVSRLISNPKFKHQSSGPGAGLVELGYLTKGRQRGLNQIKGYKLICPREVDGYVYRPDGSAQKLRVLTNRQSQDYLQKKLEQELSSNEMVGEATPEHIILNDSVFFRADVEEDIRGFHEGLKTEVPDAVYEHFNLTRPKTREGF